MAYFSFYEKRKVPTYDDSSQVQPGEVTIDSDRCKGCLLCIRLCPAKAIERNGKTAVLKPLGLNECMACGDCAAFCPEDAIRLTREHRCTGMYKTIDQGRLSLPRL
jgi:2-oxoglutarate ferredoxin oxidoreductase subunit delta